MKIRAGPRTLECRGGGAYSWTQNTQIRGYDVSGVSRKGGVWEGVSPSDIGGGGRSPKKIWEIVVPEKRFLSLF